MNWKVKNTLFHLFEVLPGGEKLYYILQKYVTKSVWVDDTQFKHYYDSKVLKHLEVIDKYGEEDISTASFFEFGAGWDMLAPIGFALEGAKRYVAVDLNCYMRPELVKNTVDLYLRNKEFVINCRPISSSMQRKMEMMETFSFSSSRIKDDLESLGIEYYAPLDAGNTPFTSDCMDYVISNVSLEHIPYEEINKIFQECYRLMKSGGVISATVDYSDHWQHTDSNISIFNYLRYSDSEWEKYNPKMHYQNRLRRRNYVELLERNGFKVLEIVPYEGDRQLLDDIEIDERFKKYDFEELRLIGDHFIARKS